MNNSICDDLASYLCGKGFSAKSWRGTRVYLNGYGRDMKVWFELDDGGIKESFDATRPLDGFALESFSNATCPIPWLINRAKQVKYLVMCQCVERGITTEKPSCWQEVIL